MNLAEQIERLPENLLRAVRERGFDSEELQRWAGLVGTDRDVRNRLPGAVEPPKPADVVDAPVPGSDAHARYREIGLEALRAGELAVVVLAGGMATRMGGVVKALVDALPDRTFLSLRLAEREMVRRLSGRAHPLWLMTSQATHGPIQSALRAHATTLSSEASAAFSREVALFEQNVSLRLSPKPGGGAELFLDAEGEPSVYATGHGDLPDALRRSGLLARFLEGGGKWLWLENLDNLGATVDPAILGQHIDQLGGAAGEGSALTVELADKVAGDRGGGPVRWNGRRIITEEFRYPIGFDPGSVPVFNTNTFLVDARRLADLSMSFTYVEVDKTVGGQRAVQFERLLGEITVAIEPRWLRIPREGAPSRFLPVKDDAELVLRRPQIEAAMRDRGIL